MTHEFGSGLNPDGKPNWNAWLDEKWVHSILRGLITQTPHLLLKLAAYSGIETIRGGKVIFHWNFDLVQLVNDVFDSTVLQTLQIFWMSPLRYSPLIIDIDLPHLECIHPDMVTIVACITLTGEASKALQQSDGSTLIIPFELNLSMLTMNEKFSDHEPKIPRFQIQATQRVKSICWACRKSFPNLDSYMTCKRCKIAVYCNAGCARTGDQQGHTEICAALPDACSSPFKRCLNAPQ